MKSYWIFLLWVLLIIAGFFIPTADAPSYEFAIPDPNGKILMPPISYPARRYLLSHNSKRDTNITISFDGTINSIEPSSEEVLWSFSSGSALFSAYQAHPDYTSGEENSFLDGVIKLYVNYSNHDSFIKVFKKTFLYAVAEEVSSKRGKSRTSWSKRSTVFILDAKSGRLIKAYELGDTSSGLGLHGDGNKSFLSKQDNKNLLEPNTIDLKSAELLCIIRTDYALKYLKGISGEVLSSVTCSEVEIDFDYYGIENSLPGGSFNPRNELILGYEGALRMLPRHAEDILVPNPDSAPVLSSSHIGRLRKPNHKGGFPSQPVVAHQGLAALPVALTSQPSENNNSPHNSEWWKVTSRLKAASFRFFLVTFLLLFTWFVGLLAFIRHKSIKQLNDSRGKNTVVPRRKKSRKLGNSKNSANSEKNGKNSSSDEVEERANGFPRIEINGKEPWSNLTRPVGDGVEGRMVGKLFVSNVEIAKGSNGTVVLEGIYDGRPVAVKRLVQTHHDVAFKEIQNLIASDRHPNVVRWYGVEYDSDFVYLALERCTCSLHDLIEICSNSSQNSALIKDNSTESVNEYNVQLDSVKGLDKDVALWKENGYPSPQLLKIMRDVVSGLAHLHELGIVHRDLKPQNVLIIKERYLCAKLSDMGISKRLFGDMSSLGHHATGYGSSGWQAPEQLLHGRQTRAVDLFSLGCVLFFCITGGRHPFGDRLERDINIVKNQVDLFMVEHIPEAVDIFSHLLDPNPELRIKALDVLHHPLFWNSEMRLSFLRDASDRVELEDRENESDLLKALENVAPVALGGNWGEKLEATFITNIGHYRRYKFDSTRDLLRVIRNKLNHYRELPKEIQGILGPVPEGFDAYFGSRFPKLLIEVFKVLSKYCGEEECFWKYFKSNLINSL